MKKSVFRISGSIAVIGGLFACLATGEAAGEVGVGININIGPPPITIPAPPEVVMVPQSQVYFVPGNSFDVFYHSGYWWSPRGGTWYRSRAYNGPWGVIDRRYVPQPVIRMPQNYQHMYEREKHIPYGQWKKENGHKKKHGHGDKHGEGKGKGKGHDKD